MAMIGQKALLSSIIAAALLSSGFFGFYLGTNQNSAISDTELIDSSISEALKNDEVVVRVHDSAGNLKYEQKQHNIITSAGAIYFCVQMNRCESHITGEATDVLSSATPLWWVQFISGTPNTGKPTAADCTAPSGGGALSGVVSSGRCITDFGSSPAQYQTGGSILTVSLTSGSGQLRGVSGTYDTTNNFVQTTGATVCSIVNDGSAPSSGTCQFTDTTPVLTNMSGGSLTVSGLALAGGTGTGSTAGPLLIAESDITNVTLANGDTISVSWTIVT
jgi:hypothetical protein